MSAYKQHPLVLAWGRTVGNVNVPILVDDAGVVQTSGSGDGGTPALPFNSVQFNNSGAFGGSADFTWDGSQVFLSGVVALDSVPVLSFAPTFASEPLSYVNYVMSDWHFIRTASGVTNGDFSNPAAYAFSGEIAGGDYLSNGDGLQLVAFSTTSSGDASTSYTSGLFNYVNINDSSHTDEAEGFFTRIAVRDTATVGVAVAGRGYIDIEAGHITTAAGLQAILSLGPSASVDTAIGLWSTFKVGSSATAATTAYGVKVDTVAYGLTNYAIWTDGSAPSVFGGSVTATDFIVSGSRFKSDTTNAHTGGLAVYDVDGAAYKDFLVWTNATAPAVVLSTPSGGTFSGDFSTLTIASAAVATQTYVNSQGFITTVGASSGTGDLVRVTSATLITPALGTPSALVLTNATGLPEGGLSLTDITTANVSDTKHGFAPKFPNNTTTFLRGDGTYAAPISSGVTSIATTSPISGGTITTTGTISLLVNTDFAFTAGQTITEAVGISALTLTGATQIVSHPVINASQTWNASGTTFKGIVLTVTDTASASGSLLLDLLIGASSKFSVRKDGIVTSSAGFTASAGNFTCSAAGGLNINNASATVNFNNDTYMTRGGAAATLQHGQDINGAAVNQIIQAANGITGTDKTGGNFTWASGKGTGAGAVSSLILQTPTMLTTGTTAQSLATRLTVSSASLNATVPIAFGGNLCISNAAPTISSGFGSGATIAGIAGGFRITCGTTPGTGGTVAFNTTYANAPVCFVQDETTGILGIAAPTTTTVVVSGLTLLSGQTVAVFVFGY